ncbi:MAG: 30S ribosomal protein S6 [Lachnospiraceae bacterium]|nr:30S ribosomal protein S6 [Lachnospiraceae bacterium]
MHQYELALVLDATIEDEARADILENIKALIERYEGQVTDIDEWGKRKLAYEIQKMPEGYYYFVQIDAPGTTPSELEQRLRIMDHVLRFLIVRKDEEEE